MRNNRLINTPAEGRMSITDRHIFGLQKEVELKGRLEEAIGEQLTKTKGRYDAVDFTGNSHLVELKCRRNILPTQYDTWLLPTSKRPKEFGEGTRDTLYIYHFEADDSLWFLYYDPDLFSGFVKDTPAWHPTYQEHWYIPANLWTKI